VEIITTTTKDELKLDAVMTQLLPTEAKHSKTESSDGTQALYARGNQGRAGHQGIGGSKKPGGNNFNKRPGYQSQKKGKCYYCHKPGHYESECRKKAADQKASAAHTVTTASQAVALTVSAGLPSDIKSLWTIDSGSQRHLTPNLELLTELRTLDKPVKVLFGNKGVGLARTEGTAVFTTQVKGSTRMIKLCNVLHVPECTVGNLFSVKQATHNGARAVFEPNGYCHIDLNGETVMEGFSKDEGLYFTSAKPALEEAVAGAVKAQESPQLWHRRFGHLGYDNLASLVKDDLVTGINVPADDFKAAGTNVCEPCVKGKHARTPFSTSETGKASRPLELVHMDVCGPVTPQSRGGANYLATFLDDYSGLSVVKPLAHKHQVAETVIDTLKFLETQCGNRQAKVRTLRTDRGSEYLNQTLSSYCKKEGIKHETTAPYSPQQNGAAERLNRVLFDRVRAMLADSDLPKTMWAEAVVTANYIRNRSPTAARHKTPWELFFGNPPDVSHLRVFGSTVYAHVPKELRKKLDPLSQKGIFVGYEANSKAYRILLDTGKMIVSRDVIFDENASLKSQADIQPPETVEWNLDDETPTRERESTSSGGDNRPPPDDQERNTGNDGDTQDQEDRPSSRFIPREPREQLDESENRYPKRNRQPPEPWWDSKCSKHQKVALALATTVEPETVEEALSGPDSEFWRQAINEELASLHSNQTWTLAKLPDGAKPIPVRWIFKIKRDAKGNIERYKARLVAKGFMQREGIDFTEVYAPTNKHTTLRMLLSQVASEDMELHQLDVKTAFLNGELEEEIYMKQPPGFEEGGPDIVCHLHKALYGLKQAPRAWFMKLKEELEAIGFTESSADPGLYILHGKEHSVYILVYVDDFLVASKDATMIKDVKSKLKSVFDIKDLGDAKYYLGMEIERDREAKTLKITQRRMTTEILNKYGLNECKTKATPLSVSTKLVKEPDNLLDTSKYPYRELVGSLLYLAVCTRPDIAQAVGALTRFMSAPSLSHWLAAKGVLRYLAGTPDYGILFSSQGNVFGYCDADYAGDPDTRRSTTGYVFSSGGGAISWSSRLQPTVAVSTAEAEYMAAAHAVKEALWLRNLITDFGKSPGTMLLYSDNQAALTLLKHPVTSLRSKHIDVIYHFARERVARKEVEFKYLSTDKMVADVLTKPLPEAKFKACCESMGLCS
jgi:transposase InsO family protein